MPFVQYTRPSQAVLSQIEEAKNRKDWFFAVVFSAIHLERQAYFLVKDHMKSLKVRFNAKSLEHLHLPQLALFLLALGKIDQAEYKTMQQINKVRNKFIHRKEHYKYKIGTAAKQEYGPLIEDVLSLLKGKLREDIVFVSKT